MNNTKIIEQYCELGNKGKIITFSVASILMILKILLYCNMMSMRKGVVIVTALTFIISAALFFIFKRKWISGILYFLFSTLMVVDVNYYSFFHRSLSVKALGAASLIGGVSDSVKEIFMAKSLLLEVDAVILLVAAIFLTTKQYKPVLDSLWKHTINLKFRIFVLGVLLAVIGGYIFVSPEANTNIDNILSQEFYAYHVRDIAGVSTSDEEINIDEVLLIEGDYDKEKSGKDFGCAEKKNLIVIQVEAMQNFVINREYNGQEITPFINSLIKDDTFYFDSYYQQTGSGNTSDAELATNNSMFGSMLSYTYNLFQDNYWRGLPVLLCNSGYNTMAFHAYEPTYWNREGAYPNQGFTTFYSGDFFDEKEIVGMGLSDSEMFSQSVDVLKTAYQPFYGFMVTLSSHYPFNIKGNLEISEEDENTLFGDYLQSMNYVDSCLKELFDKLKESGLYENTVVAFYGDHLGMNPMTVDVQERMTEYLGWDYSYEDAMNVPLVIHVPGSGKHETIETVGGQTDFLPTMAYLLGFDELDTIYFGHNLCTVKNNFVPVRSYIPQGSFLMGDIMFKVSNSGLIEDAEVVNIRTHEKLKNPEKYMYYYKKAAQIQNTSDYYIENNIMSRVYQQGYSLENLVAESYDKGYVSKIDVQSEITSAAAVSGKTKGVFCKENFDKLYNDGVRAFYLNLVWTNDGHTLAMNNIHEFDKYFTNSAEINSYDSILNAKNNNAIEGITLVTGAEFIEWAKNHKDAVFYISVDDEELVGGPALIERIYFARTLKKTYPDILDRTIFVAKNTSSMKEYIDEGLYNVILRDDDDISVKDLAELVTNNHLYGVETNETKAKKLAKKLEDTDCLIYVDIKDEKEKKSVQSSGITGVVLIP